MISLFFLLLGPAIALSADWAQQWEAKVPGKPAAAFFSAGNGKIYVSTNLNSGRAAVYALTDTGQLEAKAIIEADGTAGPLRGNGDRILWAAGNQILSFTAEGEKRKVEATAESAPIDLAVDGKGKIFWGLKSGLFTEGKRILGVPVQGLFFWGSDLFLLNDGKALQSAFDPKVKSEVICSGQCSGLERIPDGSWLTVKGKNAISAGKGNRILVSGKTVPGKPAYLYRRETKEDLLILPVPGEGVVRAFRAP